MNAKTKCSVPDCLTETRVGSRSGLCKKHYCYKWKSENPLKTAANSKATYERNREYYIRSTANSRKVARKQHIEVALRDTLRSRLVRALKDNQKAGSAISDLGCSIEELKKHLESKFKPGMSWDNWSLAGWHIDHIEPLSNFDLSNPEQFKVACHYTNLQPLWAEDNLRKSNHGL